MPIGNFFGSMPAWLQRQLAEEALLGGPLGGSSPPSYNNPNDPPARPPALPNLPSSPPVAAPAPAVPPGGEMRMPPARQTRAGELDEAREVFLKKPEGRFKSGLKGALYGAIEGLRSGGGLGGALGGAAAGGATGAISPKTIRRQEFETQIRPQIEERFGMEDAEAAQRMGIEREMLDREHKRAQINEMNRRNLPRPERRQSLMGSPSQGIYDPNTHEMILPAPQERLRPYWAKVEENGREVWRDLNAKENQGKSFKALRRPERRGSGSSAKSMQKAVEEFDRTKQALEDATRRGDEGMIEDLRRRLQTQAANLASRYGDQLETGGGDWPYWKPRGQSAAPQGDDEVRAYAKRFKISIEAARRELMEQ